MKLKEIKAKSYFMLKINQIFHPMEQSALKNVNNCWNTEISFYLETPGGQKFILYLNVVHLFNTSVN
jgi:hypothetical protein